MNKRKTIRGISKDSHRLQKIFNVSGSESANRSTRLFIEDRKAQRKAKRKKSQVDAKLAVPHGHIKPSLKISKATDKPKFIDDENNTSILEDLLAGKKKDDEEIRRLGKKLKFKTGKIPKSFYDEGLGLLHELCEMKFEDKGEDGAMLDVRDDESLERKHVDGLKGEYSVEVGDEGVLSSEGSIMDDSDI
ncbi:MAG: hypothetical protein AAF757_31775, partial [Cyanobacteria bacterium P01_D01_bin.116]